MSVFWPVFTLFASEAEGTSLPPNLPTAASPTVTVPMDLDVPSHHDAGHTHTPDTLYLRVEFGAVLPRPIFRDGTTSSSATETARHMPSKSMTATSPYEWSSARKQTITWLCCAAAIFASYASSSYAPCKDQLVAEWEGISGEAVLVGITTFTTGFGLGPMFLAPFSELRGRKPVFCVTGLLFLVCQICCAVTKSYPGMLVARFFTGVGSSTYSTLVGGVISDIYRPWERNVPMAIFSGGALAGIGLGPLVCGFIGEYSTWRWVFWHQSIANAVLVGCFVLFVPETRDSILLRRECERLNEWVEKLERRDLACFDLSQLGKPGHQTVRRVRWTLGDVEGGPDPKANLGSLIAISLARPFAMLSREPIVTYLSLWATFSWSVLYIALAVIPLMFTDVYGFSLSEANAVFAAACVGPVIAAVVCVVQDRWLDRKRPMNETQSQPPENRLYFTCVESFLLPAGLFMFGWTARADLHWILPSIAIGISTAGIFSIYLSVFNYLSDSYRSFASSALAAQSACRNIVGGILPLVTTQLYTGLGYGPGSSLLGGIAVLLCMGSWVLVLYGEALRSRSPFAQVLAKSG